ncbi:MAG: hypothetical protein K2L93_07270 [Muribaculaceae bacterium]|nr:hypothetical protein [Muribaculaceae bacterium]MDE6322083.1 hypothetical protein [Muribaculaceae bacterium]
MKDIPKSWLLTVIILLLNSPSIDATNIVTYVVSDSIDTSSEKLKIELESFSNGDDKVRISFKLKCANVPFTIYDAKWVNCDSTILPSEPFSLIAQTNEVSGKNTEWHISLDFPFSDTFEDRDVLILNTDKGIVRCPTSPTGRLREEMDLLLTDLENQLDQSKTDTRKAWQFLYITLAAVIVIGSTVLFIVKRRLTRKRKEIEELSMLISERTDRNHELEAQVNALYSSRLDTLNMLCNEYFEKSESEKVKLSLYNEVEKHILALRDTKSITELESIVNKYMDNILLKVHEQIPGLNRKDLIFLTYLYAGFSPRAICIFTDIKIKNYYNRRSRLKDRILESNAQDKEIFVSKM